MKQLNVFCEGQTEQEFCAQVLRPHLFPHGDGVIHTLAVGEKDHRHLYGLGKRSRYVKIRKFICNTIKDRIRDGVYFKTLFDLYGLPNDFPGKAATVRDPADPTPYVLALEEEFRKDINCHRFIPHLQLHEYETMLLADPEAFRIAFDHCDDAIEKLKNLVNSVASIEHVNDDKQTAPSKRIIDVIPEYLYFPQLPPNAP